MPAFLNSKSHLGLCVVAVFVASSCGLRTTLDSESSSPGATSATPAPSSGTLGGTPDASTPGGGLKADAGLGPDVVSLTPPDAKASDLAQNLPQPLIPDAGLQVGPDVGLQVGPDAGLRVGPDAGQRDAVAADARGPIVVPSDAGGRGPIGIADSGLLSPDARTIRAPVGVDAGFAVPPPVGDGGFVFAIPGIDGGFVFGGGAGPGAGPGAGAGAGGGRGAGAGAGAGRGAGAGG